MKPEINRDTVLAKTRQVFANEDTETIVGLLDQYGIEPYEREQASVQLAILKLSGGDSDKLLRYIGVAKTDYRDVSAWAEYPNESRRGTKLKRYRELNDIPIEEIREIDRQQYLDWLNAEPSK